MKEMPEGWYNFKSLGRVQRDQHSGRMIAIAAQLMTEMAEALEKYADPRFDWGHNHSGDTNCDFGEAAIIALKKFDDWK